jgi:hypothetical protein
LPRDSKFFRDHPVGALVKRWPISIADLSWGENSSIVIQSLANIEAKNMSPAKKSSIPAEKIKLYEKLLATIPEIERKGANNPFTALNGNMFSLLLSPAGRMALRLSKQDREQFLKKYKTTLFEAYGATMREYVSVPDALLANTGELKKYLALSYAYAKTLKPKTKKKK